MIEWCRIFPTELPRIGKSIGNYGSQKERVSKIAATLSQALFGFALSGRSVLPGWLLFAWADGQSYSTATSEHPFSVGASFTN